MKRSLLSAALVGLVLLPWQVRAQDAAHNYMACVGGPDETRAQVQALVAKCGPEYGVPDYNNLAYGADDNAVSVKTNDFFKPVPQSVIDGQNADVAALTKQQMAQADLKTQQAAQAQLNSQIAKLTADMQQAQAQLDAANGQVAGDKTDLKNKADALGADQTALAMANQQVVVDQGQIANLEAQIKTLQDQMTVAGADTGKIQDQITQLNQQQTAVKRQLNSVDQPALDAAKAKIGQDQAGINGSQADLTKGETKANDLQGRVNNDASQIASLKSQVAGIEALIQNDLSVKTLPPDKAGATKKLQDCGIPTQRCSIFDTNLTPKIDDIMSNRDPVAQADQALLQQAGRAGTLNDPSVIQAHGAAQGFLYGMPREYSTPDSVVSAATQVDAAKAVVDVKVARAWQVTRDALTLLQNQQSAHLNPDKSNPSSDDKTDKSSMGASKGDAEKAGTYDPTKMGHVAEIGLLRLAENQGGSGAAGPHGAGAAFSPDGYAGIPGGRSVGGPLSAAGAGPGASTGGQGMGKFFDSYRSDEERLALARRMLAAGDFEGAEQQARELLARDPKNAAAWRALARAQIGQKKYADAAVSATRAIELNGKDAAAYALRAFAKDAMGDRAGALADITRAAELDGRYRELARLAKSGGRISEQNVDEVEFPRGFALSGPWISLLVFLFGGGLIVGIAFWLRRMREKAKQAAAQAAPPPAASAPGATRPQPPAAA